MALGAIVKGVEVGRSGGPVVLINATIVCDDDYTTGGTVGFQAILRAALDVGDIEILAVVQQNIGDFRAMYDKANDKLIVDVMSAGVEVANAADISGTTFELLVVAK